MSEAAQRPRSIAAVIVSYRTGPALFECLKAALAASDIDEVIVVDNGNPEDDAARLAALAAEREPFTLIAGQGNVGFARGCNLGARAARAEHLLFLNPDAMIADGAAAALRAAGAARARPWIAGGLTRNLDGGEQRGARRGAFTPWTTFVEMSGLAALGRWAPAFASIHYDGSPLPDGPAPVPTVSGACMLMRADDFAALGGFDEGYFLHVEDIDICRRAREQGGEVVTVPAAEVVHVGATSDASALKVARCKGQSFARYFVKFARSPASRLAARAAGPAIVGLAVAQGAMRNLRRNRR